MADGVNISPGSGVVVASDEIGGQQYQRVKLTHGADGTATDASAAAPLPVTMTGGATAAKQDTLITAAQAIQAAAEAIKTAVETLDNAIAGSEMQVDVVSAPLPTGGATAANQTALLAAVDGLESALAGSLAVTGPVTDTQLRATPVPVSGTVTASVSGVATAANQTTAITALAAMQTALQLLDNAIAGNELQVDVVTLPNVTIGAALPAGNNNVGDVDVASVTLPTAIYAGQKVVTTAGTQVALAASQAILSGVNVKAKSTNTGMIFVGQSTVDSATGYVLDAGETVFIEVANLATVFVDSSVNGEGVSYSAT